MPSRLPLCTHSPARPCFVQRTATPFARFHTTPRWRADDEDYYQVLGVPPSASQTDIKKSFYSLSKKHHPDHNPGDPNASKRFTAISTAYATVGNPSKRSTYDLTRPSHSSGGRTRPSGSHSSSSSAPFGSRSPSGLSKRRTQFHGPPPSFYRSGGWGFHGAKRSANQNTAGSAGDTEGGSKGQSTASPPGWGFSPGQGAPKGSDYDVPHFDRDGHLRTHTQHEQRMRRRMAEEGEGYDMRGGAMDFFVRFMVISGIIGFACAVPALWSSGGPTARRREEG